MTNNSEILSLKPESIWKHFVDLSAIPRASKKEEKISAFMKSFGEKLGLETIMDENGNVLIKKPATAGKEKSPTVVLQSHIDMVHQKNSDTHFDFATQGIEMYVDGDFVKAKGTTLGADNGIGVATIMSILESKDIPHPAIEALFTVDEETGMTGAKTLAPGFLSGDIMLNLDTEDDDELTIGCAGGIDVTVSGTYKKTENKNCDSYVISLKGLTGGHSGVDILLNRANANKLMNEVLIALNEKFDIDFCSIEGGSLRNAIPRESKAVICVNENLQEIKNEIEVLKNKFKTEFSETDPELDLSISQTESSSNCIDRNFISSFLNATKDCPNGVYSMVKGIDGLVQTSNNVAKITLKDGEFSVQCLTRSSDDNEKMELAEKIKSSYKSVENASTEFSSDYPGWLPQPDSDLVKLCSGIYENMFNEKMHVNAIHAGLECGIIGAHYPKMQMVSFGPNIFGAHSPDERAQISSVQKFWDYLKKVLDSL